LPRVTGVSSCSSEHEKTIAPPADGAMAVAPELREAQASALELRVQHQRHREAAVRGALRRVVTMRSKVTARLRFVARHDVALDPPVKLPGFEVRMYWHERHHRDPAQQWFRELVRAVAEPSLEA
jgi:DNA-binding transcriptional LysR family regulator